MYSSELSYSPALLFSCMLFLFRDSSTCPHLSEDSDVSSCSSVIFAPFFFLPNVSISFLLLEDFLGCWLTWDCLVMCVVIKSPCFQDELSLPLVYCPRLMPVLAQILELGFIRFIGSWVHLQATTRGAAGLSWARPGSTMDPGTSVKSGRYHQQEGG